MSETTPEVRVGDRERRVVDDRLMAAVGDGVLTLHEYDERSALLWQARTRGDLDALVADLPAPSHAAPAPADSRDGVRPQRVVAVLSEDRFAGALTPGQDVRGYAVMGKAVVDLRREDLPSGTTVQVRSLLGEVEVQVPPGSVVQLSGLSVMGERKVEVEQGPGPVVHVDAVAVLGSVKVTSGDGRVVPTGPPARGHLPHPAPAQPPHRLVHRSRALGRAKGLLVPAAVLAAVVLAGPDNVSVFGDSVERVAAGDRDVQISNLFGSTTVVVPDDRTVEFGGLFLFGSRECEAECATDEGEVVHVRTFGGFGSVEVVTKSQYAAEQRRERAEDRRDDDD